MTKKITFKELRRIKDSLPDGSVQQLAEEFNIEAQTVRNYFGGVNYSEGKSIGIHKEQGGPGGGIVELDDTAILDRAMEIIGSN